MHGPMNIKVMPDLVYDLGSDIKHGFLASSDAELLLMHLGRAASEWSGKTAWPHV